MIKFLYIFSYLVIGFISGIFFEYYYIGFELNVVRKKINNLKEEIKKFKKEG